MRVLELSDSIAGAYCTRVLATLGADVVTQEPAEGSVAIRPSRPQLRRGKQARDGRLVLGRRGALFEHFGFSRMHRLQAGLGDVGFGDSAFIYPINALSPKFEIRN